MAQPMSSSVKGVVSIDVSSNRLKHRKGVYIDWQTVCTFLSFSLTSPSSSNNIFVFNFTFLLSSFLAAAIFVLSFLVFNSFSSVFSWKKKKLWFVFKAWEVSCLDHLPMLTDAMQKWLLENYSFVSLAPFLTIKLKKKLQKECLNSSEASYNSRDEVICTQKIRLWFQRWCYVYTKTQVMIPEMMLFVHKK